MRNFDYFEPGTLEEAVSLLEKYGAQAKPIAGGTDLLIQMERREIVPNYLVNVKTISRLDKVEDNSSGNLTIGAATELRRLEEDPIMQEKYQALREVVSLMGSIQIRNLATVGGNLCNAAPSADTAPPLLVLDAQAEIVGPDGERIIPLEEFFVGPGETVLKTGEILKSLRLAAPQPKTGTSYLRISARRAMSIAFVGAASKIALADDGTCADARIALAAVAPTPIRAREAEDLLRGEELTENLIEQAASAAQAASKPISDLRSSAEYRREIVGVLTKRTLQTALERAGGGLSR